MIDPSARCFPADRRRHVVAHIVEGGLGGVGQFVRRMCDSQSNDPDIAEVHLFADPEKADELLLEAQAIFHPYRSSRAIYKVWDIATWLDWNLDTIQPTVIYLHSTYPGIYGRLRGRRRTAAVTIYCPHGWCFTQQLSSPKQTLYTFVERILARRCSAVVSVSQSEYDAARRAGVDSPVHRVILHGLPDRATAKRCLLNGFDRSRLNVGFVGRFDQQKGVDILLSSFAHPSVANVDLWLIGDQTLGKRCHVPAQDNIHRLGWIENSQIDGLIAEVDALVIPSRWEAFGFVALEAMRNGKAVLASNVGGLAEIVVDGETGRLFEPGDTLALRHLLLTTPKEELAVMGLRGRRLFESRFRWDSCYANWRGLLQELTHEGRATDRRNVGQGGLSRDVFVAEVR